MQNSSVCLLYCISAHSFVSLGNEDNEMMLEMLNENSPSLCPCVCGDRVGEFARVSLEYRYTPLGTSVLVRQGEFGQQRT